MLAPAAGPPPPSPILGILVSETRGDEDGRQGGAAPLLPPPQERPR